MFIICVCDINYLIFILYGDVDDNGGGDDDDEGHNNVDYRRKCINYFGDLKYLVGFLVW